MAKRRYHYVTRDEHDRILLMHKRHVPLKEIASELGITTRTARNHINGTCKPHVWKFDSDRIREAREMWEQGATASDIAKRFGTTRSAIYALMDRNRDAFPLKCQALTTSERAEIVRMLGSGHTYQQTADYIGCGLTTIWRVASKARRRE